jgi:hypothetical protein
VNDLDPVRLYFATQIFRGKSDHQRARERPGLAFEIFNVRDRDAGFFKNFTLNAFFKTFAGIDEARYQTVNVVGEFFVVRKQYFIFFNDGDDYRRRYGGI